MNPSKLLENRQLVVADYHCPKIRDLLATSHVPVLWLNCSQDPLITVSQALEQHRANGSPIHALHWVSHGEPGTLLIGSKLLNTKDLLNSYKQLGSWRVNTIALWSCSTGTDHTFISVLEELTGSTVWASHRPLGRLIDGSSRQER